MCIALDHWLNLKSIETLLTTFIQPLQEAPDKHGRIHCSMNLNTETGRLSARKPNLQNQPSGDKDIYKIRRAFVAEPGNQLIVADYGQLELRILAHMTNCKGMIEAFKLGGDFHSRTALVSSHMLSDFLRRECILRFNRTSTRASASWSGTTPKVSPQFLF